MWAAVTHEEKIRNGCGGDQRDTVRAASQRHLRCGGANGGFLVAAMWHYFEGDTAFTADAAFTGDVAFMGDACAGGV
jgi:hypothetical protein